MGKVKKISLWMSDEEYQLVTSLTSIPTVNLVILRVKEKKREVLLIVRKTGYAKDWWCMIGGRVCKGESLEKAINRHVSDLGIKVKIIPPFNSNFPCFIDDRNTQDETKHPVSMVYPAKIVSGKVRNEGEEYKGYKWFPIDKLPEIAYGQKLQIKKTIEKLNVMIIQYSTNEFKHMRKRSQKPYISVMIAALNEEKNIEKTVRETLKIKKYKLEVLVVLDSKTTDRTAEVAKKARAKVIQTGKWLGKGAALRIALPSAKGDIIVQMDADYQFMPYDIPKLVEPLLNGYDVALGSRYEKGGNPEKGSVTKLRRFGIYGLSLLTSLFCGQRITDMPAGFKAFKKDVLKDINMQINHYGYEAEVIIKAAQKGYKIICVPVDYKSRVVGNSKLIPFKDGYLFLKTILGVGLKRY